MAMQPAATLAVIKAAKEGDDAAFERLLEPLYEPAYRMAAGLLQDHQAGQDAVQEAAVKAWQKLAQLREGAEMRPWFNKIVVNQCRTLLRSRRSTVTLEDANAITESADEDLVARIELRRALRAMKEEKREVLVLHFYLDLPLDEIAATLGLSPRGAETRLQRAKDELKRRMEASRGRR